MKLCTYCGRRNEDEATVCPGCGTDAFKPETSEAGQTARTVPWPKNLTGWLSLGLRILAFAVFFQGFIRCAYTPSDPKAGEGDYQTAAAEYHFLAFALVAVVLFALGVWLKGVNRKKEHRRA